MRSPNPIKVKPKVVETFVPPSRPEIKTIRPTPVSKAWPAPLEGFPPSNLLPKPDEGGSGPYREVPYADLRTFQRREEKWIWRGMVASGNVTLLTGQWAWGKTTLMAVLLSRLKSGGDLAGQRLTAGRAIVISEESLEVWHERSQVFAFGDHLSWFCRPFLGKPTVDDWQALLDQIARIHEQRKTQVVVIDSLANLGPMRSENEAGEMLKTLLPLRRLTNLGMAVVVLHHPRKGRVLPGQAARGSGALPGFADIIVEMRPMNPRNGQDRRRRLRAYSRYIETPPTWVIELTADGTDYTSLGPDGAPEFEIAWPMLRQILENAPGPLTREEILRQWPENSARPPKSTLCRWLARLIREGEVLSDGVGTTKEPHRFSQPGMEAKWQDRQWEDFHRRLGLPPPKMR